MNYMLSKGYITQDDQKHVSIERPNNRSMGLKLLKAPEELLPEAMVAFLQKPNVLSECDLATCRAWLEMDQDQPLQILKVTGSYEIGRSVPVNGLTIYGANERKDNSGRVSLSIPGHLFDANWPKTPSQINPWGGYKSRKCVFVFPEDEDRRDHLLIVFHFEQEKP